MVQNLCTSTGHWTVWEKKKKLFLLYCIGYHQMLAVVFLAEKQLLFNSMSYQLCRVENILEVICFLVLQLDRCEATIDLKHEVTVSQNWLSSCYYSMKRIDDFSSQNPCIPLENLSVRKCEISLSRKTAFKIQNLGSLIRVFSTFSKSGAQFNDKGANLLLLA